MVSPSSDRTEADSAFMPKESVPAKSKSDLLAQMDTELMFRLIDSILPFEACLYHQVLPLSLEGSRIRLGMVNLEDSAALDYVRRILAYMNCSLVPQTITSEVHHAALTAYLNYSGKKKPALGRKPALKSPLSTASTESEQPESDAARQVNGDRPFTDRSIAPTLLVDSPDDISSATDTATTPRQQTVKQDLTHTEARQSAPPRAPSPGQRPMPSVSPPGASLPLLEVNAQHTADPIEVLAALPPDRLLQELLGRILVDGIGRLYFERQPQYGRILWSQNGVLQSVLEQLPLETLQGVINELKQLTRLPLAPAQKPQQVEIERLYQKHRLLLRLRIMPTPQGEEATLQVLRGAALKFYQQQQLTSLSRDALGVAQELQRKVNELRTRTNLYPTMSSEQLAVLPELRQVLKDVEQQLEALRHLQDETLPEYE